MFYRAHVPFVVVFLLFVVTFLCVQIKGRPPQ
jgi:hypothetical protein